MNFDPFGDGGEAAARDEVDAIRRGDSSMSDAQAAEMLVDSVSGVMVSVATGGPEIKKVDASYKRKHRALGAALKRLGIDYPNRYPDLWTWHGRWSQGDMPKYSDRRVYVADLFAPIREALADLKQATHELAKGVGDGGPTGWPQIDAQLQRLQRLFDAETDLPDGEEEPGADDAKARISYFVRRVVPGKEGENIRKLGPAYAQANTAKHRYTATRIDAGVAANATALIVSTLRLLSEEDGTRVEVVSGAGEI